MKVADAMHTTVVWVSPDTPLTELAERMRDNDIGAIPVGENGKVVGMVTDRDITCRGVADGGNVGRLSARDIMSSPVLSCTADEDLDEAIELMEGHAIRRLPVLDRYERLVGILGIGDVAAFADEVHAGEAIRGVSAHHR